MKNLIISFIYMALFSSVVVGSIVEASVEVSEVRTYFKMHESLYELKKTNMLDKTLLAFDIDETLLVVEDCLKPKESSGFGGWLKMVYSCPARLAEEGVSDYLGIFQGWGIDTIALTARAENLLSPTERELSRNNIIFKDRPYGSDDNFREAFTAKSSVVFKDGVTYSSGRNKGDVLKTLLRELPHKYEQVIFVDDSLKNIKAMQKAFQDNDRVHVRIYHYTRHN